MSAACPTEGGDENLRRLVDRLGGIRVRDLPVLIKSLNAAGWCLIFGLCVVLSGLVAAIAYSSYPFINASASTPVRRQKPAAVHVASAEWPSVAQSGPNNSWLVPLAYYLEEEGQASLTVGRCIDAVPVLIETKPFDDATSRFDLMVSSSSERVVRGYAFRVARSTDATEFSPLAVSIDRKGGNSIPTFSVAESERGDSIVLLLLVLSEKELPDQPLEVARSLSFDVL